MLPKIIHYCWFGDKAIPENYAAYIKEWQEFNPDYKIMRWDESNSPMHLKFMKNAQKNGNWAKMADLTRLYALLQYGGIYLDTDTKLIKPLDKLLPDKCFLGFGEGQEGNDVFWVYTGVIGAMPEHKFIKLCYDTIIERFDGTEVANLSGPLIITELLKEKWNLKKYGYQKLDDIVLYPIDTFYPIKHDDAYKIREGDLGDHKESFAIHTWGRSWYTKEELLETIDGLNKYIKEQKEYIISLEKVFESRQELLREKELYGDNIKAILEIVRNIENQPGLKQTVADLTAQIKEKDILIENILIKTGQHEQTIAELTTQMKEKDTLLEKTLIKNKIYQNNQEQFAMQKSNMLQRINLLEELVQHMRIKERLKRLIRLKGF